jgi:hypothetical protein
MKSIEVLRCMIVKYPLIGDGTLLLLVVGSAFFVQPAYWGLQPPYLNALVTIISACLAIIPTIWRHHFLIIALIFIAVTWAVPDVFNIVNLSSIASIMAIFSKSAYGGRRRNIFCFTSIIAFNGGLAYKLIISSNTGFINCETVFNVVGLFWSLSTFFTVWWFGNTMRDSRKRTSLLGTSTERILKRARKNTLRTAFYGLVRVSKILFGTVALDLRVITKRACVVGRVLNEYLEKKPNILNRSEQSILYRVTKICRIFRPLWDKKQFASNLVQSELQQLEISSTEARTSELQVIVKTEGDKREIPQVA